MRPTRRSLVGSGLVAAISPILDRFGLPFAGAASAQQNNAERDWQHALSLFGELKYSPNFKHFDYVNPSAPKGGGVRMIALSLSEACLRIATATAPNCSLFVP